MDFSPAARRHFRDYIKWSQTIDAARYASAAEAHDLANPHILLSRVIGLLDDPGLFGAVVALVAQEGAGDVLTTPLFCPIAARAKREEETLHRLLAPRVSYDGVVAYLDQSDQTTPYQRYLPYLLYPEASYVVGIYRKGKQFNVSVGANPWKKPPVIHIGLLCKAWGGGGHAAVGGITVSELTEATRIAREVHSKLLEPR